MTVVAADISVDRPVAGGWRPAVGGGHHHAAAGRRRRPVSGNQRASERRRGSQVALASAILHSPLISYRRLTN